MKLALNQMRIHLDIGVRGINVDEDSDEDFEDDEVKNTAIYQVDLQQAIKQFVQNNWKQDRVGFESLCQALPVHHRNLLPELI
jgi:hypothetical protein